MKKSNQKNQTNEPNGIEWQILELHTCWSKMTLYATHNANWNETLKKKWFIINKLETVSTKKLNNEINNYLNLFIFIFWENVPIMEGHGLEITLQSALEVLTFVVPQFSAFAVFSYTVHWWCQPVLQHLKVLYGGHLLVRRLLLIWFIRLALLIGRVFGNSLHSISFITVGS